MKKDVKVIAHDDLEEVTQDINAEDEKCERAAATAEKIIKSLRRCEEKQVIIIILTLKLDISYRNYEEKSFITLAKWIPPFLSPYVEVDQMLTDGLKFHTILTSGPDGDVDKEKIDL